MGANHCRRADIFRARRLALANTEVGAPGTLVDLRRPI